MAADEVDEWLEQAAALLLVTAWRAYLACEHEARSTTGKTGEHPGILTARHGSARECQVKETRVRKRKERVKVSKQLVTEDLSYARRDMLRARRDELVQLKAVAAKQWRDGEGRLRAAWTNAAHRHEVAYDEAATEAD